MCLKTINQVIHPIKPSGTISISLASSILLDKLDEIGDEKAGIFLPDNEMKVYSKEAVKSFLKLDETDKITYVAESMDCDDFAAKLFGKFASLIWTWKHALNWFIEYNTNVFWFIEPQTDKLSQNLDKWQGWDVRFFVGR